MSRHLRNAWLVGITFVMLSTPPLEAQGLDPASAEALSATLRMLADPVSRGQAILSTPGAAEVDRQVQSVAGSPQIAEEMYAIAAAVFADLAKSSGGDAARMSQALERAKSDPAGFAALLSPETLRRLRELSAKVSDVKR
jgi:hypothetical protein